MFVNHPIDSAISNINILSERITNLIVQNSKLHHYSQKDMPQTFKESVTKLLFLKIRDRIVNKKSIRLMLPSFPYKSPNPKRVLGPMPDLAEELSIQSLSKLCSSINSITPFGCELIIASDGRVYGDLQQEWWPDFNDQTITSYRTALEKMIATQSSHIRIFSLDELGIHYGRDVPSYLENYSPDINLISNKIVNDPCQKRVYTDMKYFRQEELKCSPAAKLLTKKAIKRAAAAFTIQQIRRGHAWSNIVDKYFPDTIRLSVHSHFNTEKLGISLTKNILPNCYGLDPTPWHNCALISNQGKSVKFIKYSEGLEAGAKVLYKEDQRYALEI
jgi:pyoverdine/dityrosine biosynthesis protein Dit1